MTAHELARELLAGPDLPFIINGWGSDEGLGPFVVTGVNVGNGSISPDYDSDTDRFEEPAGKGTNFNE